MKLKIAACLSGLALVAIAGTASGQRSSAGIADSIEQGSWNLRVRGGGEPERRVCMSSARDLVQLRHRGLACKRVVVSDGPTGFSVQYTCPGKGYGRTTVRKETARLLQFDTQGIENGLPFAFSGEARYAGRC